MFVSSRFDNVKKAGLLFLLLTQSMVVQAQAPDVSEAAAGSTVASGREEQRQRFPFPRWPERQQVNREVIPPAPPGPYMSSALRNFSVEGTSFARDMNKPAIKVGSSDAPMQAFSPDIPWPSTIKSPHRWKSASDYLYVERGAKKKLYPVKPFNGSSNYNNRYRRGSVMGWPDLSRLRGGYGPQTSPFMGSSARPVTGVNQARPYPGRSYVLSPDNRRNSGSGRSNPAMNQFVNQSCNPACRASRSYSARP